MAVTISGGELTRWGSFHAVENASNSTATGLTTLDLDVPISTIAGGTATGFAINRFLLPTSGAVEGQIKEVVMLATGEAHLVLTGTATGALVLTDANDRVKVRFMNAFWMQEVNSATVATATGTA